MNSKAQPIRIVILEDDDSYIRTLRLVIETDPGLVFVAAFRDPKRYLNAIDDLDFDVALLDINLPSITGLDCLGRLKQIKPRCRAIMLTVDDESSRIHRAFTEGADGYLLKDSSPDQVGQAIREVLDGGAPMSPAIARRVIRLLGNNRSTFHYCDSQSIVAQILSTREREVLSLLSKGFRNIEIAEKLCISLDTVKTHTRSIYSKLKVRNRTEAVNIFTNNSFKNDAGP